MIFGSVQSYLKGGGVKFGKIKSADLSEGKLGLLPRFLDMIEKFERAINHLSCQFSKSSTNEHRERLSLFNRVFMAKFNLRNSSLLRGTPLILSSHQTWTKMSLCRKKKSFFYHTLNNKKRAFPSYDQSWYIFRLKSHDFVVKMSL